MLGLIWYLELKNWSLQKMELQPHGSDLSDIRMNYGVFFQNAFSAIDYVADKLPKTKSKSFLDSVSARFPSPYDFEYGRELRNAIVHRGFDAIESAAIHHGALVVHLPTFVPDRHGNKLTINGYANLLAYAICLNDLLNTAIFEAWKADLVDFDVHEASMIDAVESIEMAPFIPNHVKAASSHMLGQLNWSQINADIAQARTEKFKRLLGR